MTGFQLSRNWRILVLGPSAELAAEIRAVLAEESPGTQIFDVRSYPDSASIPKLLANQGLSICFVDAATSPQTALPLIREIQQTAPEVGIIAMLATGDPDLILGCLRQGASEFLTKPISAPQVEQVFRRIAQSHPQLAQPSGSARTIAVVPAKGACGASTVALNLAFQRKKLGAKKALLADLDALAGTVSFMLSARASYSFLDALDRGASLDTDVWKGLIHTTDGVDILHSPESASEAVYEIREPGPLLDFARQHYDLIVADMASPYGLWNTAVMKAADEILLVTTSDAWALRSAQRALRYLAVHKIPPSKVRLIVNRFSRDFGIGTAVAQEVLHTEIFATLPADYEAVQRALIEGKPIAASSVFGKSLVSLAEALGGPKAAPSVEKPPASPPKSGALSGLMSLLSRKPNPSR